MGLRDTEPMTARLRLSVSVTAGSFFCLDHTLETQVGWRACSLQDDS